MLGRRGGRARRASEPMPADVLVVCTGNICRTPIMAAMLAAAVPGLTVASAGTHAVVGSAASPYGEQVLRARGLSAAGHRARQLTPGMVAGARLVLTATGAHRAEAVRLHPAAADTTYSLKELARLLAATDLPAGAGLDAVLAAARDALATDTEPGPDDDLDDPIGQPVDGYERCAAEVAAALAPIVRVLSPAAIAADAAGEQPGSTGRR